MKLLNLTPHAINIISKDQTLTIKPEETPARVGSYTFKESTIVINNIPIDIVNTQFTTVENLPELKAGTFLIVSRLVATAAGNREDLLVPGELVRNNEGVIIGCLNLSR